MVLADLLAESHPLISSEGLKPGMAPGPITATAFKVTDFGPIGSTVGGSCFWIDSISGQSEAVMGGEGPITSPLAALASEWKLTSISVLVAAGGSCSTTGVRGPL